MARTPGNEKFIRRQKEVKRQKAQEEKRQRRAERKAQGKSGGAGEDDVAAIQAALDAGLNPGAPEETLEDESQGEQGESH
jgi:hypothetical protein